jgi:hypothetical protein
LFHGPTTNANDSLISFAISAVLSNQSKTSNFHKNGENV